MCVCVISLHLDYWGVSSPEACSPEAWDHGKGNQPRNFGLVQITWDNISIKMG